jgi:hypothetical protein
MRSRLALAVALAVLAGGAMAAAVAAATPASGASTLRPWGRGLTAPGAVTAQATPAGATRLVVLGRDEARCTIMFRGDVLCDATFVIAGRGQLTVEGVGLTFAVTGGTGEFKKARGQMQETFLPTGEFRFAFTLFL